MRFAFSVLTALVLAFAAMCFGSAGAQAQTFKFQVCNKTDRLAQVALASHLKVGDENWQAEGWWRVNAGQCLMIGTFPQGWFYYYAKSSNGDWHGSDKDSSKTCVKASQFQRPDPPGYKCTSDETLVSFNGKYIDNGGTFTWTLD